MGNPGKAEKVAGGGVLRSPCETCERRDLPKGDCAPHCERRIAYLEATRRDTRFDQEMVPDFKKVGQPHRDLRDPELQNSPGSGGPSLKISEKTNKEEKSMGEANMVTVEAGFCPRHPEERQVVIGGNGPRAGQLMGQCRLCLQERAARTGAARRGKKIETPEAPKEKGKRRAGGTPAPKDACSTRRPPHKTPARSPEDEHREALIKQIEAAAAPEFLLLLDFGAYRQLIPDLEKAAAKGVRTVEQQGVWLIKCGLEGNGNGPAGGTPAR